MNVRIGIHSGEVHAGNVGSQDRLNYTVLGNTVNLAARLEPANKVFGTSVLVSDFVREKAGRDFIFRCIGFITIRGFAHPVRVHELINATSKLSNSEVTKMQNYTHVDAALMQSQGYDLPISMLQKYVTDFPDDLPAANCSKLATTANISFSDKLTSI